MTTKEEKGMMDNPAEKKSKKKKRLVGRMDSVPMEAIKKLYHKMMAS